MEAIGMYLLKSAAWLTGFALVYLLVLRNEHFFRLNRVYLLAGIIASLLFPFYTFHYAVILPAITSSLDIGELSVGTVVQEQASPLTIYFWIYLLGSLAFLFRLLFQTWKIIRKLQKAGYERSGAVKLVRTPEFVSSFSFFSFVFVNPSIATQEMEEIMNHEREHIQQRHWFDLLLVELICIVQWFNPFAWIYAHLIRQNHEFLADESALQRTANPAVYQATLLNQLLGVPVFSLTNSFSYSLNKKRFKMMKKKIDSPFRKLKMLLVLPFVAMLFYAFAAPEYRYGSENSSVAPEGKTMDVKGQVLKSDGTTPLSGTSVILRGSTLGTITDKDGNFLLKGIPADGELVFSFVGFSSKVQKVEEKPMKIVMEVSKVGLDQVTVNGNGTPPPPPPPPPPAGNKMLLDTSNPPLIFLDGVEISQSAMSKIDPSNIESMNVFKNESAKERYGDKGKNGVVLIKTKRKVGGSGSFTTAGYDISKGRLSPKEVEQLQDNGVPTFIVDSVGKIVAGTGKVQIVSAVGSDPAKLPMIFLDGIPVTKDEMDQIDPETIISMTVLKGEDAAKYGEKGKNGVIMITSKNPPLTLLDGVAIDKNAENKIDPLTIDHVDVLRGKSGTKFYGEKGKNGVVLITTKAKAGKGTSTTPPPSPHFPPVPSTGIDNVNPPLIFLDGVPITKAAMDKLNPETFESINVLKDKSATNVYGEKGKNGVILIKTKTKAGDPANAPLTYSSERTTKQNGTTVFVVVEEMPEFPGGEEALRKIIAENVKYPAEAAKEGIQGKVFVTFVVKSDGTVADAKIARGVHPLLDNEAIRVLNLLPTWKPGKQRGQNVNVSYTIPVQFKLDGDKNAKQEAVMVTKVNGPRPDGVYVVVEEMPEFPGGEQALRELIAKTVKYPADAIKEGIQGKVFVTFVVKSDGTVGDAKIARSVNASLDNEAIRVINLLPKWKPGKQKGKEVNVSYTIPVMFALDGGKSKETTSSVPAKINEKGEKEVFIVVEEMPEYPGGSVELRKFIARSVKYPAEAQKEKAQGKVYISFVVSSTGKVENAKIERSVSPALDAEALRVINLMPEWKPGKQRGQAVSVEYTMPIEFKLQ